jgi:hypothetical protein
MAKTADQLIEQVKVTAMVPENQETFTDTRILSVADEEIYNDLLPMIDSIRQNYFVVSEDETVVSGQSDYKIPYRAVGLKLRDLQYINGNNVKSLSQLQLEDAHVYSTTSTTDFFYIISNNIRLVGTPNSSGYTLRKFYMIRPSSLTKVTNCGKIVGISSNVLTLDAVPTTFTVDTKVDITSGFGGCVNVATSKTITNVSGVLVTLDSVPTSVVVGDYVSLEEKSCMFQFPDDFFGYLVSRVSMRVLESLGDTEGSQNIKARLPQIKANLLKLVDPRVDGAQTKIVNRNGLIRRRGNMQRYVRSNIS